MNVLENKKVLPHNGIRTPDHPACSRLTIINSSFMQNIFSDDVDSMGENANIIRKREMLFVVSRKLVGSKAIANMFMPIERNSGKVKHKDIKQID